MRIGVAIWIAVLPAVGHAAESFLTTPANSGVVRRQMPNGERLFTFSTQWPPKIPSGLNVDTEVILVDTLAKLLAQADWCSGGWEIVNRTSPTKDSLVIEGRCK